MLSLSIHASICSLFPNCFIPLTLSVAILTRSLLMPSTILNSSCVINCVCSLLVVCPCFSLSMVDCSVWCKWAVALHWRACFFLISLLIFLVIIALLDLSPPLVFRGKASCSILNLVAANLVSAGIILICSGSESLMCTAADLPATRRLYTKGWHNGLSRMSWWWVDDALSWWDSVLMFFVVLCCWLVFVFHRIRV